MTISFARANRSRRRITAAWAYDRAWTDRPSCRRQSSAARHFFQGHKRIWLQAASSP